MFFILEIILQGAGSSIGDIVSMDTIKNEDGIALFFNSEEDAINHGKRYCCGTWSVYPVNNKVHNNGQEFFIKE